MANVQTGVDALRRVILVTDGDEVARRALEQAAASLGARIISRSAGNPTPISAGAICDYVLQAAHDPVIVMLDDNGAGGRGPGERALEVIMKHPRLRVIGILAVASNTSHTRGARVDFSIDRHGHIVDAGVNKHGYKHRSPRKMVYGDTVDILRKWNRPVLVGIGDIGKMKGLDDLHHCVRVTTEALRLVIELDPLAPCYQPR
ncbi:MAG: stage V sporulation protein AE [Firmicutes bacterium]|nr:stage V sporulation protein AE [Bacillota bacterium]